MNNKPNNPPAFPKENAAFEPQEGMALRDYFAAKAMQTLVAKMNYDFRIQLGEYTGLRDTENSIAVIAIMGYRIADAMLTEREKTNA